METLEKRPEADLQAMGHFLVLPAPQWPGHLY